jgi:hypothetical protein
MATRPAACPACGGHGDTGDISVVNDWPDVTPIAASELAVIGTYRSNLCCQAPPSATVSLIRDKISIERVATALQLGNVDLATLVAAARRLNEIDERRPYRIETAALIAAKMNQ